MSLSEGARGPDVARLRAYLARYGYLPDLGALAADGDADFDTATADALKRYQRFFKLEVTGELDDATAEMMSRPRCGVPDFQTGARAYVYSGYKWEGVSVLRWHLTSPGPFTQSEAAGTIVSAFTQWDDQIPLSFEETSDPSLAHIIFRWVANDGQWGTLAYAYFPPAPGQPLLGTERGDVYYDTAENWTLSQPTPGDAAGFYEVTLHEIGHSLGLHHTDVDAAVMWPSFVRDRRTLHSDDIAGIQFIYPAPPPPPPVPGTPTGVTAEALSSSQIRISWTAVANATSYMVAVSDSASGPFSNMEQTTNTSLVAQGLPPSTTKYYVVRAENSSGSSGDSAVVSATTQAGAAVPAVPTGVSATALSASEIRVDWTAVSGATSYQVGISNSATGPFSNPGATTSSTSHTTTGLPAGVTRYFVVRSVNSAGASANSAVVSATTSTGEIPALKSLLEGLASLGLLVNQTTS